MLGKAYRLPFRLLGIPVLLDVSFLLILPFLAWTISRDLPVYFRTFGIDGGSSLAPVIRYLLGFSAAIGLFLSVLIHELGHAVVGKFYRLEVRNITLWLLGGMAQFERMPTRSGVEAVIALAGPVTSYLLGALCWTLANLVPGEFWPARFLLIFLFYTNVVLATFNLLPALPLDGGRVLRSVLALFMPHLRATEIAATLSKTLAFFLGMIGLLTVEVFLILIAFFVYMAVSSEERQASVGQLLQGFRVSELMTAPARTVAASMTMTDVIHQMFLHRHLGFPVLDDQGGLLGVVTLEDAQKCRSDWARYADARVESVIHRAPLTIDQNASAAEAFEKMSRNAFQRLIALDESGKVAGILTKTDVMNALRVRSVESELESR